MTERVTFTVEPSMSQGEHLAAEDALRHLLDLVTVLNSARQPESDIEWQIIELSTNSPIRATLEGISASGDPMADTLARRQLELARDAYAAPSPDDLEWLAVEGRQSMARIMERHCRAVGKTTIVANDSDRPVVIVERTAIAYAAANELTDALDPAEYDYSRTVLGTIEGLILRAETNRGRAQLVLRERISARDVKCILPPELAQEIGADHSLLDVWGHTRVRVSGRIQRDRHGSALRIEVRHIETVSPPTVSLADIQDPDFAGSLTVAQYLEKIRGERLG